MLGGLYEAVQVEHVSFEPVDLPTNEPSGSDRPDIDAPYVQEGMAPIAGDLFRCDPGAALLVPPLPAVGKGDYQLSIAFRPVVHRDAANEARKAA
jgi:hypothetical protein